MNSVTWSFSSTKCRTYYLDATQAYRKSIESKRGWPRGSGCGRHPVSCWLSASVYCCLLADQKSALPVLLMIFSPSLRLRLACACWRCSLCSRSLCPVPVWTPSEGRWCPVAGSCSRLDVVDRKSPGSSTCYKWDMVALNESVRLMLLAHFNCQPDRISCLYF